MLVTLSDVLPAARKGGYAVGLFNTVNLEMARSVIAAAEALRSPVIIGTAEILLPYGPMAELADLLLPMAKRASVPVVVHYDHGLTFENTLLALRYGFSSVMYDRSTRPYADNLADVREMARIAHAFGASIEAELGHVGNAEGSGGDGGPASPADFYTDPAQARDYAEHTEVDALAVAVGTAHGAYRLPPKLDFERIEQIAALIPTPLVLHGGSGLADTDFRRAVRCGISKVNIFTDLNAAGAAGLQKGLEEGKRSLTDLIPCQLEAMQAAVETKIRLFGSDGRA